MVSIPKKTPIFMIICAVIMLAVLLTYEVREENLDRKVPVPFDKSSSEEKIYASVEIDFLTPIVQYRGDGMLSTKYYLYGNSETGEFGITSIEEYVFWEDIIEKGEKVTLYGYTKTIDDTSRYYITNPSKTDSPVYELPTGNFGCPEEAFELFSENVGEIGYDSDFGLVYLNASLEPEPVKSTLNSFINVLGYVAAAGIILPMIIIVLLSFIGIPIKEKD